MPPSPVSSPIVDDSRVMPTTVVGWVVGSLSLPVRWL